MTYLEVDFETDRNFENLEEVLERIDDPINKDGWFGDYSITRNDGLKALIYFDTQWFIMKVSPPRREIIQ
ncbi:unnamed protein product [Caenorhabditis nigoni]